MGIGDYNGSQDLKGVGMDYKNSIHAFNKKYKYSVFYRNKKNENVYSQQEIKNFKKSRVKLHWSEKDSSNDDDDDDHEILDFFRDARNIIVQNKHDSLIAIISSHGDVDGVILDSNGEELPLMYIYHIFSRDECDYLKDKPKLVFVDACRGRMQSRVSSNTSDVSIATKSLTSITDVINSSGGGTEEDSKITFEEKKNSDKELKETELGEKDEKQQIKDVIDKEENSNVIKQLFEEKKYHKEGNFRFIYANIEGYATVDGGKKGGYLIQAIHSVFLKVDTVLKSNLDAIVYQINDQSKKKVGTSVVVQRIEDVNRMDGIVTFQIKDA